MSVRTEVIESRVQPTAEDIAKGVPEKGEYHAQES